MPEKSQVNYRLSAGLPCLRTRSEGRHVRHDRSLIELGPVQFELRIIFGWVNNEARLSAPPGEEAVFAMVDLPDPFNGGTSQNRSFFRLAAETDRGIVHFTSPEAGIILYRRSRSTFRFVNAHRRGATT